MGQGHREPFTIYPHDKWVILDAVAGIVLSQMRLPIIEIGSSYGDAVKAKRKSSNILVDLNLL